MGKGSVFALIPIFLLATISESKPLLPVPEKVLSVVEAAAIENRAIAAFSEIVRGDIDGDGIDDLVAVFQLQGFCEKGDNQPRGTCSNHYADFLQAFLGKEMKPTSYLEVSDQTGKRFIKSVKIQNQQIVANLSAYNAGDPMCCPSLNVKAVFVLKNGRIKELKP